MKITSDIFNWAFQSGAIVWLFYFGFTVGKPWIDSKIKHAKTAQQREVWALLEQVAMTTVNSLVSSSKSGSQKFLEASNQVQSYLAAHDVHLDMKTVQSAVQAAYEQSPLTSTSTSGQAERAEQPQTGVVVNGQPITDPVLQAAETAPNRANDVKGA